MTHECAICGYQGSPKDVEQHMIEADDQMSWSEHRALASDCFRKGHVYWNHGTPDEGNKCLDCGQAKETKE